ncbi:HlyD family type I secretion periplasmic adaptor subunit [Palleronia sp. KMU-117]|uniref:HlyD family type I secretion periplasmic adaptor subunit n=1 Tax=Palleronia sp. KMU-117 TaxID=3434108 RepID=UPI003D7335C5
MSAASKDWPVRGPVLTGVGALVLLIGVLGVWSVRTTLSGAVIASGMVVVESNRQVIQHPEGGVVGEILARNGDQVEAGQTLIRFDDTLLRSELAVLDAQLIEIQARKARLEAEALGAATIDFPDALLAIADTNPEAAAQIRGQEDLFTARIGTLGQQAQQLDEQILQIENQIEGTTAQLTALGTQEELIVGELADQESLFERGLVPVGRVIELRREAARLAGEIGKLTSEVAQLRGQIAAIEIEKLRLDATRREEAIVTLRDIQFREIELSERRLGLEERLSRLEVRSPVPGVVYDQQVFAVQSVVQAGAPMMYVIPQDQPLLVQARVSSVHVDEVRLGQEAVLRFTAFDQRRTPEMTGHVAAISADVFVDERTGANFYEIQLLPGPDELSKLDGQVLLPGMPVEAFIRTEDRTPISYLTKPLTDYFNRAFRES